VNTQTDRLSVLLYIEIKKITPRIYVDVKSLWSLHYFEKLATYNSGTTIFFIYSYIVAVRWGPNSAE